MYFITTYSIATPGTIVLLFYAIHNNFLLLVDNVPKTIYEKPDEYQAFFLLCRNPFHCEMCAFLQKNKFMSNHFIIRRYSLTSIYFMPTYYLFHRKQLLCFADSITIFISYQTMCSKLFMRCSTYIRHLCYYVVITFRCSILCSYKKKLMIMMKWFTRLRVISIPFCWSPLFF